MSGPPPRSGYADEGGARITPFTDPALHADALQEVFVRAFDPKALLAYDGKRDYAPYLTIIGRNVLVDMHHGGRSR